MSKSYTLVLNLRSNKNVVDTINNVIYVNWRSFLPTEYNQYIVSFSFYGAGTTRVVEGMSYSFNITLDTIHSTDQTYTGMHMLGFYQPSTYAYGGEHRSSHDSKEYGNIKTLINYPNNNYIKVQFKDETGADYVRAYIIFLNFRPVIENKKKKKLSRFRRKRRY